MKSKLVHEKHFYKTGIRLKTEPSSLFDKYAICLLVNSFFYFRKCKQPILIKVNYTNKSTAKSR